MYKKFFKERFTAGFSQISKELPKFAFCMAGRVVPINSKHLRDFLKIF